MVRARDALGGLLIFVGIVGTLFQLQTEIIEFGVQQATGLPSFITGLFTPDLTGEEQINIGISLFVAFIGVLMVASGRNKKHKLRPF